MTAFYEPDVYEAARRLKGQYGTTRFVETGCYHGSALQAVYDLGFEDVLTCDIYPEFVAECREKFPKADVRLQEAVSFLKEVVDETPTMFWLDAHFAGLWGEAEVERFPLPKELAVIAEQCPRSVVICDDMRVLDGPRQEWGIHEAIYQIPVKLDDITRVMKDSHDTDLSLMNYGTCVLIFTPRYTTG